MTDGDRMLCLTQASVSFFLVHNIGAAQLVLFFEKTGGTVQLASLLNSFFDEAFEVLSVYDARKKIVDFEVTDSRGTSSRERIFILLVTLARSEAKSDSAPDFCRISYV